MEWFEAKVMDEICSLTVRAVLAGSVIVKGEKLMAYNVAVDVGGTFTDVLLFNEETGSLTIEKVLSTTQNQSVGVQTGVREACRKADISMESLQRFFHGTTVVTNMLLEANGARVGLITTAGHEQILHVARAWTPGPLYGWVVLRKPDPLADLNDTRGVEERISATGQEIRHLDEDALRNVIRELVDSGVEALAIVFLNAYVNASHEQKARDIGQALYPQLPISISSDMVQELGEYERALTTVINTYVRPRVIRYLGGLDESLSSDGFHGAMNIVRSDGGNMSSSSAMARPVDIALSGPSGGVVGAAYLARMINIPNVLTLDMGGTSTDVSLCLDGLPTIRREIQLGYYRFKSPAVDVHSVGAGGGSIAHVSSAGSLLVGPASAGSQPGPASYGRGGVEATVTDANVVLHHLPPTTKLGGTLTLDEDAARRAIQKVADQLNLSLEETAQGILDIVNENMYAALRVVSIERGHDPRTFGLVAFGGAGPMHANALGRLIGSWPVIVPPTPGVMSAFGFLSSNIQNEFSKTYMRLAEDTPSSSLRQEISALMDEAKEWLQGEGVTEHDVHFETFVDCRYYLQGIQISCPVSLNDLTGANCSTIRGQFESEHRQRYGFDLDLPIEMATIRVVGRGSVRGVDLRASNPAVNPVEEAKMRTESVYFTREWLQTDIYHRERLQPGHKVLGPAVVIQDDSTTVIEPGFAGVVDNFHNILIQKEDIS